MNIEKLDESYAYPDNYKFIADGKLRSPWYDDQCAQATSDVEIAAELDISYENSVGGPLIRSELLTTIIARAKPPLFTGEMVFSDFADDAKFVDDRIMQKSGGRLQLWIPLDAQSRPPKSEYVVCADPAGGSDSKQSAATVICVADKTSKQKVARFKSSSIYATDAGVYAVALCKFFGGAQLCWETNGSVGAGFKRAAMVDMRYRNVWTKDSNELAIDPTDSNQPGWHSSKDKKKFLLTEYVHAIVEGRYFNPSADGLKEISEYAYLPNGAIEHQRSLRSKTTANDEHGDEVIADALCCKLVSDGGRFAEKNSEQFTTFPVGSYGWRREQYLKKQKQQKYY